MNLLPKSTIDFGKEKFWDSFFSKSKQFEWYGEYDSLCEIFNKYIRTKDKILVVGCGNSKLSADLYDAGFLSITNIDISSTVILQMSKKYAKKYPLMAFERMDILQMAFESDAYNVILDKGTLDAIMVDTLADTTEKVNKMFTEIARVLKLGGRYICVSLLQEHILQKLLDWFVKEGWMIRVNRCFQAEKKQGSINFPVFTVICTKMRKISGSLTVLELALDAENKPRRVNSEAEIMENIKSVQHFALLKHTLNKRKLAGENVYLDLCCTKSGKVKYRLYVVDIEKSVALKFAIFIVPQGRETEWLFSTTEGRIQCALSANCQRLVVVHLLRDFEHKDLEEVKQDLSANVMELAPSDLKSQVPFLSVGDDVGSRAICVNGKSDISGSYVVEDVRISEREIYRRLIFLNRPYLIQSEAKLKKVQRKNKNKKTYDLKVDFDYLACEHHSVMIAGLVFLGSRMLSPRILQVGLGGGGLAMYLYTHFPSANIEVVELDSAVVETAKDWFGVIMSERLSIHIGDGLTYMEELARKGCHYDILMLDVDSKDSSIGISCPPLEFVSEEVLYTMSELVSNNGVLLMNLVCRDAKLHKEICCRISSKFVTVFQRQIPNEVNEVLYCMNFVVPEGFLSNTQTEFTKLNEHIRKHSNSEGNFDVNKTIQNIQVLSINDS